MLFASKALVSIHDVMPDNINEIDKIIELLKQYEIDKITLLVVPGKDWDNKDIEKLKYYENSGIELAGHGWSHLVKDIRGLYHNIHSKIISRNEAEHLSLEKNEIIKIVKNSYTWFEYFGLNRPKLYVPPAWTIGKIDKKDLVNLGYIFLETGFGVHDLVNNFFYPIPVTGYMADTNLRVKSLKVFNHLNFLLPFELIRISIHPLDLNYPLLTDLKRHLRKIKKFLSYSELEKEMNFQNKTISKQSFNHKKMSYDYDKR